MNFPEYVKFTLDRLEENGYSAYLVGGCVRDFIMGIVPHDFDITTDAAPEQIEECFKDLKTLDVGKKHGTISVVFDKEIVEVTTYRIDGEYRDSRHPESVTFTDKIEADLSRRDFTMNAIAYSPKRGFVDPFDGRNDIERRKIVCVGNPEKRFEEDALRILRALRFSSRLGFEIESNTKQAIFDKREQLLNIAVERINSELSGILDGSYASDVISVFIDVFRTVIPSLSYVDFNAVKRAENYGINVKLCLFFSCYDNKDKLTKLLKDLKFDNNTVKTVTGVVSLLKCYSGKYDDCDVKRAVSKVGVDCTQILYQTLYCHTGDDACISALRSLSEFVGSGECMSVSQLNIKGNEIIETLCINPSMTGVILSRLLDDVIDEIVQNEKSALLERAKTYTKQN